MLGLVVAIFAVMPGKIAIAQQAFKLQLFGRWVEGTPLVATEKQVFLLARDGQMWEFAPSEAQSYSKSSSTFHAYSQAEMRGQLMREFGSKFEVSGSGHYLVVHLAGQKDLWAPRFEELYRSFVHYFNTRAFRPSEPRFPMVAVVYPRQADFQRAATADGSKNAQNMLGYYSPKTNRIVLFDVTAGRTGQDWATNADTIIHEATHQMAFNAGMHNRFGQSPQWVCEGLATMFEARGIWNGRVHQNQADRVNRIQLAAFRRYQPRRGANAIAETVSADRAFEKDAAGAYAEAWALSFFLSEQEPRKYVQYLMKTAAVKDFTQYPAPQRLKDFTDVFGSNLGQLDARMKRFIGELK
ncbi:MAG: DUF1570 domain-containing protein [Pirellulaceae bacterium]